MFLLDLLTLNLALAHAAKDGHVTQAEVIEALTRVFPDRLEIVLEQVKGELNDAGFVGVDEVVEIAAAFAK